MKCAFLTFQGGTRSIGNAIMGGLSSQVFAHELFTERTISAMSLPSCIQDDFYKNNLKKSRKNEKTEAL